MSNRHLKIVWFISTLFIITSCVESKYGSAKKNEKVTMNAPPKRDVINYSLLKKQQEQPLTFAARSESSPRGLETAFAGGLVSLGFAAVKQVIGNEDKKYTSEWRQGLNDLYFYDQPSSEGPFDPTGMQFNGFNITRTFIDNGITKTAISADFEVDKDSVQSNEIINDAIFRLKLKNIKINYAKAKIPLGRDTINIDFDIIFTTSYISKDGNMFRDMVLGRFLLRLRKVPMDSTSKGYAAYFSKLKNIRLDGKCFIVPRSFGYYKTNDNSVVSLYNQGMFSIAVKVRECSKDSFVNEMLINTADIGLDYEQSVILNLIQKKN